MRLRRFFSVTVGALDFGSRERDTFACCVGGQYRVRRTTDELYGVLVEWANKRSNLFISISKWCQTREVDERI